MSAVLAAGVPHGRTGRIAEAAALAALGAVQTVAFVHTALGWPLVLAAVGVLAWRASRAAPRRAAALGLAYGFGWLAAGTWWLFVSLHRYGGLPAWMAVAAVGGLAAFLSLYLAAAMAAFARWRRGHVAADALLFAALWLLAELARGVVFTGFPWLASGYAFVDAPLAVLAPWLGVYGIGFVVAALAAGAALALAEPGTPLRRAGGLLALAAVVGLLAVTGPGRFTQPSGRLAVTLLQGNVAQEEKFETRFQAEALEWHLRTMVAARGDLVVAPETAVPLLPGQLPPDFWDAMARRFAGGPTAALTGAPLGDFHQGYANAAVGLPRAGEGAAVASASAASAPAPGTYRYDKHHLVPFGEFIPPGFRWFTRMMAIPLGDFARGPLAASAFIVGGERIAPNICYEDLFGEELAARFADAARAPTVFANLSNIGWFGDTAAVPQHLAISRLRAIEFERPMLRATNTGATAVVDHRGRVTAMLAPFTRGVLEATVEGRSGLTPFARWASAAGLWPPFLLALAIVATAAALPRRRAQASG